jgi:putative transcriptional regulator
MKNWISRSRPGFFLKYVITLALILSPFGAVLRDHLVAQEQSTSLAGQLLVATPEMPDPRFAHCVIYMERHNEQGAIGLVVNQPAGKGPLAAFLKAVGIENEPANGEVTLYYGGPVEPQKVFVLHSDDYVSNATDVVGSGLAVTTNREVIRAIVQGKGPRQSRFVLGYAGWAPGQLEAEINDGGWFAIPADKSLIFDGDADTIWQRALDRRKVKT